MRNTVLILLFFPAFASSEPEAQWSVSGQACGWILRELSTPRRTRLGIRYLPEGNVGWPVGRGTLDLSASLHLRGTFRFDGYEGASSARLYRAWLRWSTDRLEMRFGLQKLDFGSAMLLRPLMWFDSLDPRDPLHLTDGVTGGMVRWVSPKNLVLQSWVLSGSGRPKGIELFPSQKGSGEYGCRVQLPVFKGELALTAHHRRATAQCTPAALICKSTTAENRLAADGRWDWIIGLWFEAALIHPEKRTFDIGDQKLFTVGADYTFPLGNGLHLMAERMMIEIDMTPMIGNTRRQFCAVQANYAVSLWDQFLAVIFFDENRREFYQFYSWRRTYDRWGWNLSLLRTPSGAALPFARTESSSLFQGNSILFMVVFNH